MTDTHLKCATLVGVAWFAAFVALDLARRLALVRAPRLRAGWLAGAAVALGTGLWSAQVLAYTMLPFRAGLPVADAAIAWLAAMGFSALALHLGCRRGIAWPMQVAAGVLLAAGVAGLQLAGAWLLGGHPQDLALPAAAAAGLAAAFAVALTITLRRPDAAGPQAHGWRAVGGLLVAAAAASLHVLVIESSGLHQLAADAAPGGLPMRAAMLLASLGTAGLLAAMLAASVGEALMRASMAQVKARMREREAHDAITGLPNKHRFDEMLAHAVRDADARSARLAVMAIDLDGFNSVNASYGQATGDGLLRQVAQRLVDAGGSACTVARLGSDQFLVLTGDAPPAEPAQALAMRLMAAVERPISVDGREVTLTASIGVALYPEHGGLGMLVPHADAALRVAKGNGGAGVTLYDRHMSRDQREQLELLRDLRGAVAARQLELYYQPKVHAPSGEITGVEALMRWHHPVRGMVSPAVFIPVAERFGLIGALGDWLIDEACRQARAWRDQGLRMRVAINLSVHQLRQLDLAARITAALARHQINPQLLTCEITESVAMNDAEATRQVLQRLAAVGVHLSIDDFGTGYSSLAYLRKLPAGELKIDRSFVLDLETSEEARTVVDGVVRLAQALELKVVAEGVETEEQGRILKQLGCDVLQGYLYAKPMSAKALALWAMDDIGPRRMDFRASLFQDTIPQLP